MYLQVNEKIREMIDDGELKAGDALMSERDISDFLNVSRMTVNKAITKLVDEGYIVREPRRGTTVAKKRPITRYENLNGLTEMKKKEGKNISNDLISFEKMALSKWLKRELQTDDEWGYKVKRVRYVDDEPLMLETVYLSKKMCPHLTATLVEGSSMYQLYERNGHHISQAEQIIRPVYLRGEQAELLGQKCGELALFIKRHSYTETGKIMEYTESIFLSQKHDLQIALS